jgi:molybdate transport system substrate-binding protein
MISRFIFACICLVGGVFAFAFTPLVPFVRAQHPSLKVAAAADLQAVMPEITKAFESAIGAHVDVSYGSSGNFVAQIQNGAPFDLFFSADDEYPQQLVNSGRAQPRSAVIYGVGRLVLWLPSNAKCNLAAERWSCLLKPEVDKIAIANPAHAPYGRAAVAALHSAHIYDQVRAKLVLGESVAQAAQFVQSGNAQAGLLAFSQVQSPALRDGQQWIVPQGAYPPIRQAVVILKSSQQKTAAMQFIEFVTQGPGRQILQQFGFQPPPSSNQPNERHK